MDPVTMIFYGLVCGVLGALAPNLGGRNIRIAIGAAVGAVSAILLPAIRSAIGT